MTVAIDCGDCGRELVFDFEDEVVRPRVSCECGAVYQLRVRKVFS